MLDVGKWIYDPTRGLSLDCKDPGVSDEDLYRYRVSTAIVPEVISHDKISGKRGKKRQSYELAEIDSDVRYASTNNYCLM